MRRAVVLALLALAGAVPAAQGAERVILEQSRPTAVKAHAGIALFSQWDGTAYRLVIARGAGPVEALPLPPQATPFDADIGPDAAGRPTVAFSRCVGADCDLFALRIGAATPTRLTRTDDPGNPESRPTLWRGRLAWVRRVRSGAGTIDRVFTRVLTAPPSVRSTSLPGVPSGGEVAELELYGTRLALSTVADQDRAGVCGQREIRLVTLGRRAVRRTAEQLCGLNGQVFSGPSFFEGRLYFARSCNQDGLCRDPSYGALRYRIRDDSYASSPQSRTLAGWAYDGEGRVYEARRECAMVEDPETGPPCVVARVSGLRFAPIARPPRPSVRSPSR